LTPKNSHAPRWPIKILRRILDTSYHEELEGDLEEVYQDNLDHHSIRYARWQFLWEVIRLIRPALMKKFHFIPRPIADIMIKNNLKISLRVFSRNRSYTFINVLSLTSALAISMLILAYVHFEMSYERDNPLADRIVRITMDYLSGGTLTDQDAEMYHPAGPAIMETIPEVSAFTRANGLPGETVQAGNEYFRESEVYVVDSSFFRLLDRPLIKGNPRTIFATPYEAVLTASVALKYFSTLDVIGESIRLSSFSQDIKITGVVHDAPPNTHLPFRILLSYPTLQAAFGNEGYGWDNNNAYTYLLLTANTQFDQLQNKLNQLTDELHAKGQILNERIVAQPLKDIHLYSHKSFEPTQNGDAISVFILLGVSILVIIIAVVNYVNLSTAKSLDRAKEVGIRKVVGSSLLQIRTQFFTESLLINLFSALAATALMILVLPQFVHMSGLPSGFSLWRDPLFIYVFAVVVVMSTLASGAFPAFILSAFKPIQVLRGKFSRSAKGALLRKALVVFQFSITIFLLIQTFTAGQQLKFMRELDLGMDIERTIVVRAPNGQEARSNEMAFKNELLSHSQFETVSLSNCVPGLPTSEMASTNVGVSLVDATEPQSFNFYIYFVDAEFLSTMRMALLTGENFRMDNKDRDLVLVNEESIRLWGIADAKAAVGKRINLWGAQRTIVGVIRNFHQTSAKSPIIPMIFFHQEDENRLISIRAGAGDPKENLELVKRVYGAVFANAPFDYFFLDQEFDKQYRSEEQFESVFSILTGFAIMISCLGLFGLVSFTVANRTKEVGIRKVLGANLTQIATLLSKDFITLILIAMVISVTITYFFVQGWLEHYAFRIAPGVRLFALPAAAVLLASLLTILIKTMQVSSANPVDALKED